MARAALARLHLADHEVPVVLGGGILRAGDPGFDAEVAEAFTRELPARPADGLVDVTGARWAAARPRPGPRGRGPGGANVPPQRPRPANHRTDRTQPVPSL